MGALPGHALSATDEDDVEGSVAARVGIAQSSLLCIDVLARKFSKQKDWVAPMTETLVEFTHMASELSLSIYGDEENDIEVEDLLKLLGSTLLCCGSLCSVSKARALPQLVVRTIFLRIF